MTPPGDRTQTDGAILRARSHLVAGRHAEAASLLEQVVDEAPEAAPAWDMLVRAYVSTGALDDAGRTAEEWRDSGAPGAPDREGVAALRRALAAAGGDGYWAWKLDRMNCASARGEHVTRMEYATAHAALGDRDEALRYLVEAVEAGEPSVLGIRSDPA
jgi:tetratricopeptide (TPR) repeat protein